MSKVSVQKAISVNEIIVLLNIHKGERNYPSSPDDIKYLTRRGYLDERGEVSERGHRFIKGIKTLSHQI